MDKYEFLVISLGRWDKEQNRRYALIISSYRYFRQLGSYHQKPRQYRSLTTVFCLFVPNPKTGLTCGQAAQVFCLKSSKIIKTLEGSSCLAVPCTKSLGTLPQISDGICVAFPLPLPVYESATTVEIHLAEDLSLPSPAEKEALFTKIAALICTIDNFLMPRNLSVYHPCVSFQILSGCTDSFLSPLPMKQLLKVYAF